MTGVRAGSRETHFHFCIVLYDLIFKIEHLFMLLVIKVKLNNNKKGVCGEQFYG